jgi:ABC-type amino acid transport substrate-binding protein
MVLRPSPRGSTPRLRRSGSVALFAAVWCATVLTACGSTSTAAGQEFEPGTDGVLTVATATLPAPGFWGGSAADEPGEGFEASLAEELADELGLDRVRVVQVPFADIAAGDLGGADVALTQMTPTDERNEVVDFTRPYLESPPAVLVRTGVEARDAFELRELRWVVVEVSTLTERVVDEIRPDTDVTTVEKRADALDLLRAGRADAFLTDLPIAQGIAQSEPKVFEVAGQLSGPEGLAVVLPDRSSNLQITDSAVRRLVADGTVDDLRDRWFGDADIPLIRTSG